MHASKEKTWLLSNAKQGGVGLQVLLRQCGRLRGVLRPGRCLQDAEEDLDRTRAGGTVGAELRGTFAAGCQVSETRDPSSRRHGWRFVRSVSAGCCPRAGGASLTEVQPQSTQKGPLLDTSTLLLSAARSNRVFSKIAFLRNNVV